MCFFNQKPVAVQTAAAPAPQRDPNSALAARARMTVLQSRGVNDAIATSPLGDPNFGKSVSRPTILGSTGAAY